MAITKLNEMNYGHRTDGPVILAYGTFENSDRFKILVVDHSGTHPCCYISIPNGYTLNTDDIWCHGGVTWAKPTLPGKINDVLPEELKGNVWWIGWDYAHFGDYLAFDGDRAIGTLWTTDELISECKDVVAQLEKIFKNKNATGININDIEVTIIALKYLIQKYGADVSLFTKLGIDAGFLSDYVSRAEAELKAIADQL